MNQTESPTKICLTASGVLIVDGKALLVKHKKLGLWLKPGGHVEDNERPHEAAEREFIEETGIKVKAINLKTYPQEFAYDFAPTPIMANEHWISKELYEARVNQTLAPEELVAKWPRGCEKHFDYQFLMAPIGSLEFVINEEENTDIRWWSLDEINNSTDIHPIIKYEMNEAFWWANWQAKNSQEN